MQHDKFTEARVKELQAVREELAELDDAIPYLAATINAQDITPRAMQSRSSADTIKAQTVHRRVARYTERLFNWQARQKALQNRIHDLELMLNGDYEEFQRSVNPLFTAPDIDGFVCEWNGETA